MSDTSPTPLEHPRRTNARQQEEARAALNAEKAAAEKARLARQESLQLLLPTSVAIIGCGGVGSWLAYMLALAGTPQLYLFDHDIVSESNLNRLPVSRDWLDKPKAEALKATILAMRPTCDIYALDAWTPEVATAMKLNTLVPWVACSTDSLASRQAAYKWSKSYHLYYIEAAAEGEFGSATGAPAEWASDLETQPGYASVPVWIGPCVTAAYLAATHILHSHPMKDEQHRLGFETKRGVKFNTYK